MAILMQTLAMAIMAIMAILAIMAPMAMANGCINMAMLGIQSKRTKKTSRLVLISPQSVEPFSSYPHLSDLKTFCV